MIASGVCDETLRTVCGIAGWLVVEALTAVVVSIWWWWVLRSYSIYASVGGGGRYASLPERLLPIDHRRPFAANQRAPVLLRTCLRDLLDTLRNEGAIHPSHSAGGETSAVKCVHLWSCGHWPAYSALASASEESQSL